MKSWIETLDGLKTYLTCTVILALLVAHWAGWLALPPEAYAALFAIAIVFLRAGVTKSGPVAVLALGALSLSLVGCGSVAPGSDPLVVRAEQLVPGAADTIDAFLKFERINEATLGKDVHRVADELRVNAPRVILAARAATRTYKENRNAENKATLETVLAVVEQLAADVGKVWTKPTASGVPVEPLQGATAGAALLVALSGIQILLDWVRKERERLAKLNEMTPEEAAAVDEKLNAMMAADWWKVR